jgi:hypothetical protein
MSHVEDPQAVVDLFKKFRTDPPPLDPSYKHTIQFTLDSVSNMFGDTLTSSKVITFNHYVRYSYVVAEITEHGYRFELEFIADRETASVDVHWEIPEGGAVPISIAGWFEVVREGQEPKVARLRMNFSEAFTSGVGLVVIQDGNGSTDD